ncbi:MAG: LexA family transcriptional regulator [Prevotella sp.]|nr:LexA family transcriptional regulator [Prevotella sp.]
MEKKDRLLSLIDHYSGGNKSEFARMIGVSPQAVNTWITRNTFDIDIIYAKCLNVSPDWLLTGKGNMLKEEEKGDVSAPIVSYDPKMGQPYYDVDFLGGFSEVYNSQVSLPDRNIIVPGFDRANLWCNVTGHSMEPQISHGDIIALRPCTINDIQYGEMYAVVLDTIRTIKILRRGSSPKYIRYIPINPNFDEQEFEVSRIINVFEVIGSISKFF